MNCTCRPYDHLAERSVKVKRTAITSLPFASGIHEVNYLVNYVDIT